MFNNKAHAIIKGGSKNPNIKGLATFTQTKQGVMVKVKIYNLPFTKDKCNNRVFGFHIHNGISCSGTKEDEFANALTHYNPGKCEHPHHSGDLPPVFENDGYAYMQVLTNRFTVKEIIGKVVIIHSNPDDFTTQPSGNSGEKIACGKIE